MAGLGCVFITGTMLHGIAGMNACIVIAFIYWWDMEKVAEVLWMVLVLNYKFIVHVGHLFVMCMYHQDQQINQREAMQY